MPLHLIARRAYITIVGIELDVCERECEDERFDCLVFLLLEPRFCDNADVRFQRGKRRAIEQRRGLIYGPVDVRSLGNLTEGSTTRLRCWGHMAI